MNGITVDEFNELVSFSYIDDIWDEETGRNISKITPIQQYQDIFAYVGNVGFTAYYKNLEQGYKDVKRLYTNELTFDNKKEIIVAYKNEQYKVVRLLKGDIFEYDMELIKDEENKK